LDEVVERKAAELRARLLAERRANVLAQERMARARGKHVIEVRSTKELLEAASGCPRNVCIVNVDEGEFWEN
jgi:hypothetical protein